jgi:AraC family transcriptional regulator of adaptative response/methylated-DNA-[protein]-cysteine methyltransferase
LAVLACMNGERMSNSEGSNYARIEKAIQFIQAHHKQQPSLDEIAAHINLSTFHFQKIFSQWAGVTPKKFIQFLTLEHAKKQLKQYRTNLNDTANEVGLYRLGRLQDLFINIESMTSGEYKNKGKGLRINYIMSDSMFGPLLIASTEKGICHISFESDLVKGLNHLKTTFANAQYKNVEDDFQLSVIKIFKQDWSDLSEIKLHIKATVFQLQVWKALLSIPASQLASYGDVANIINQPNAARAVGTAIGRNPVAYLIPCHRVIQATGKTGGYMWGEAKKSAIIAWEGSAGSR